MLLMLVSNELYMYMSCVDIVTSQHCPALQDVDSDIALVLSRCDGKTLEEIVLERCHLSSTAGGENCDVLLCSWGYNRV